MQKLARLWLLIALPGSLFAFVWFYAVYLAGHNPYYSFFQKLVILLHGAVSLAAIWYYRDKFNQGLLSFPEALVSGISTSLIVAMAAAIGIYIFGQYLHPETVPMHIQELKNYLISHKEGLIKQSGAEMYEGNLRNVDNITATSLAIDAFIWKVIQGTMFSILAGLALRRTY